MGTKLYYRQEDDETAAAIERALGRRSGYAHSQTLHQGTETSESLGEQAVPLLTARDITELDSTDIIAFHANYKPFRGKRMDWRKFPTLRQRHNLPPPVLPALPPIETEIPPSAKSAAPLFFDPDMVQ